MVACINQAYFPTPDQKTWEYAQQLLFKLGFAWEDDVQVIWTENHYPFLACLDGELQYSDESESLDDENYQALTMEWLEQAVAQNSHDLSRLSK